MTFHVVLLSGGSGSRLWPLSNDARSKQFLKVLRDKNNNHVSMVQRVFSQLETLDTPHDVTIVTNSAQENSIRSQIDGSYNLVLEPERRDTAPAIMLACAYLDLEQKCSLDDILVVMPIDSYVEDTYFKSITDLVNAVKSHKADIVLLGVKPTYNSDKYGYIIPSSSTGSPMSVKSFKEKPNPETAKQLILNGALWNCGVFAFSLKYLRELTESYYKGKTFNDFLQNYSNLPKNSFDYEIVEKANNVAVIEYSGLWKDLGTWNTLCEEMADLRSGISIGADSCNDSYVINELNLPLITLGLENLVIAATPDGILVANKDDTSNLKNYLKEIDNIRPMYEKRRWGEYRVLDTQTYRNGNNSLTKELVISCNKQISYQCHEHRTEVWTIASGCGQVVIDGKTSTVKAGDVINIYPKTKHAIKANDELHIIEVQLGDLLTEEDIERFGDFWE